MSPRGSKDCPTKCSRASEDGDHHAPRRRAHIGRFGRCLTGWVAGSPAARPGRQGWAGYPARCRRGPARAGARRRDRAGHGGSPARRHRRHGEAARAVLVLPGRDQGGRPVPGRAGRGGRIEGMAGGKAAADSWAAGGALRRGRGPDPGGLVAAAGGRPGAVRAGRRRGDPPAGVADLGAAAARWRCPGPGRRGLGPAPPAAGRVPSGLGARRPDRRAGPDATHVACSGVAGPGPCPGRRVAAAAGPAASRAAGRPAPVRAAPGAGRGPGRGRVPRPARRTGTGSRRAGRAAGLLAAARGARRVGVHGCCPAGRGTGLRPAAAGRHHGRPAGGRGGPARMPGLAGPARRRAADGVTGRPDRGGGHATAPHSGNQQPPRDRAPGRTCWSQRRIGDLKPRRAARPNRISSALPLLPGRPGQDRDRTGWPASRAATRASRRARPPVRGGSGRALATHPAQLPDTAGPVPWPGRRRRCGRPRSAPGRPAGAPRSCPGPHRPRPGPPPARRGPLPASPSRHRRRRLTGPDQLRPRRSRRPPPAPPLPPVAAGPAAPGPRGGSEPARRHRHPAPAPRALTGPAAKASKPTTPRRPEPCRTYPGRSQARAIPATSWVQVKHSGGDIAPPDADRAAG